MRLIPLVALAVVAAACGGTGPARVVPIEPARLALTPRPAQVTDDEALHAEAVSWNQWLRDLRAAARANPEQRFRSPSAAVFMRRLAREAAAHDFTVVSVRMLHARQLAPLIVVRTSDGVALAHGMPSVLLALDSDWSPRSDYEGMYFAAVDEKGVPLFLASNVIGDRWPHEFEGSEWGRTDALYPLPHY
jgi:hypothetical protein